jgi:hypothetical protein
VSRRTTAGSIFWGITLVAVGGLLLARNLGYSLPIWGAVARYWPVLIILWGLVKLVDYFRLRNDRDKRPLFSGGEVAMLILVIFAGSAITAAANISPDIGAIFDFDGNFDFWDLTGNNYQFTEHQELAVPAGSTIKIFNLYGFVDVRPAEGDRIIVDVEKTVRAASREEAETRAKDFTFSINELAGHYRIASSRDPNAFDNGGVTVGIRIGNERQRYKSNMTVKVPKKAIVEVRNRYGSVNLDGLEGNQTIANKYGSTSVHNISGAVTISTGYGSAVLEGVSGEINVTNAYASTTIRTGGSKVRVENKYGSVDVQDVQGDVSIENRYSVINAERIAGNLVIEGANNSVDIEDVSGSLEAGTSYKNLNVRNAKGSIRATNRHGNVDIELDEAPQGDITVTSRYSNVSIELPANSSFNFDGRTTYGDADSEFDGLSVNSSGRERSIRGQYGSGGPRINVETQHGNIRLQRRG